MGTGFDLKVRQLGWFAGICCGMRGEEREDGAVVKGVDDEVLGRWSYARLSVKVMMGMRRGLWKRRVGVKATVGEDEHSTQFQNLASF